MRPHQARDAGSKSRYGYLKAAQYASFILLAYPYISAKK